MFMYMAFELLSEHGHKKKQIIREIAETALAHSIKDKAEAAYARSDLLEKRAGMMEAWAQFISADASDVINIRVIMKDNFLKAVEFAKNEQVFMTEEAALKL